MRRRNFIKGALVGISWPQAEALFKSVRFQQKGSTTVSDAPRKRLRELGIQIGTLEPGPCNAITDVDGVKVGHKTIVRGDGPHAVRTGVTVIFPHSGNIYEEEVFASSFILNGWGEMTGMARLEQTGKLETPIFLTGTYNVGIVYDAALSYLSGINPEMGISDKMLTPVVAECFDEFLSDARSRAISKEDVFQAIVSAHGGSVEEGGVGGGTGMTAFGFKGGIGTSSRKVDGQYIVGVLVMANTGSREQLRIDGIPVGKEISDSHSKTGKTKSIILIAATDAPLLPYQLRKISKRVALGLAQTGSISHTESGDIILAFSTANRILRKKAGLFHNFKAVNDFWITPVYQATVEATQEAILNALTSAQTMTGRDGNTAFGLPLDQVKAIVRKFKRIREQDHE